MEDLSQHRSNHRPRKLRNNITRMTLKLCGHHFSWEGPQQSSHPLLGSLQRQTFESCPDPKLSSLFLPSSMNFPGANTRLERKWVSSREGEDEAGPRM